MNLRASEKIAKTSKTQCLIKSLIWIGACPLINLVCYRTDFFAGNFIAWRIDKERWRQKLGDLKTWYCHLIRV